jgi:hypothetical protein
LQHLDTEEQTQIFAQLIARTAKDIEILIDSLPDETVDGGVGDKSSDGRIAQLHTENEVRNV